MKKGVFIFWSVFIAGALTRVLFSLHQEKPDIGACLKQEVQGVGTITQEPERKENGQVFVVSVQELFAVPIMAISTGASNNFPANNTINSRQDIKANSLSCGSDILIRMKTRLYPRFEYGGTISFKGKISQPFNFKSDSGRSFDYKGYLAKDDVFFEIKSAVVEEFHQGATLNRQPQSRSHLGEITNKISSILFSIKRRFVANLEHTLGEPHAALAAGLVVGEKSALGKNLLNDFRTVGLIHIVVLSGFNITIVGDAIRRVLSFLPRVWGISVGGIGIALFGVMVGGGATVVRSCFMAGIALSADFIRRDYNVTRALVFAALVMLIQSPMILLHDPSFQLSFLATLGLIMLASPIEKRLAFIPEKFGIRGIIASTVATQIFVSPYILYMMGQVSIIGMVVNILILPAIPTTMLFVFLTGVVEFVSLPASQFFGWTSHLLLSYELHIVKWFARLPFASITLPIFSGWWVVAFYVGFGVVFWWVDISKKKISFAIQDEKLQTQNISLSSPSLDKIFEEFQKIPKGVLIDNPGEFIETDFMVSPQLFQFTGLNKVKVFFTRRTLKHISEKGEEGQRLLDMIPSTLRGYTSIFYSKNNKRHIVSRAIYPSHEGQFHLIVTECVDDKLVIVTTFTVKQKYLKGFKILWRTAASS